jgi:rhodanese-related sulfurtransferase
MQHLIEFILHNWILFLALIVIIVMLVMNSVRSKLLGFNELKPVDAVRLINRVGPLVLDVREDSEFGKSHITGAKHIPVAELEQRIAELEDWRERDILIYCRAGQRSAKAAAVLKRHGFTSMYKLDGGIMAWQSANLPLTRE